MNIIIILYFIYFGIFQFIYNGQTLGKKIFKLKVVEDFLNNHLSLNEAANKYEIAEKRIRDWQKLYNEGILKEGKRNDPQQVRIPSQHI